MDLVDWLTWALSIVLAVVGTWAITWQYTRRLESELAKTNTKFKALLDANRQTQQDVHRIEQGKVVADIGSEHLRPTVELAVTAALGVLIRETGADSTPEEIESTLEAALPRLAAQWRSVDPSEASRRGRIVEMISSWKQTVKSRAWSGSVRENRGGVQLGPSVWIPANVVIRNEFLDPFSFEARVAGRAWYPRVRLSLAVLTVVLAIVGLYAWPTLPPALLPPAIIGWLALLVSTAVLYSFERRLIEERLRRPDWSVLFPPGAIMEQPCQVEFGPEARTLIAPLPLAAWVGPPGNAHDPNGSPDPAHPPVDVS